MKKQLEKDCHFLTKNKIIDYSFLVGVHDKSLCLKTDNSQDKFVFFDNPIKTISLSQFNINV